MEPAATDTFLKSLLNRQRNLTKKLNRIAQKSQKAKSGKLSTEEQGLLNSRDQTLDFLNQTRRLIQQYKKGEKEAPEPKKQPRTDIDKSAQILDFWILGEFLKNPELAQTYKQQNPADVDLEPFLRFHELIRGSPGESLNTILSNVQNDISLYLAKSEKVVSGIMRTYKNIYEFTVRALKWAANKVVRSEIVVQNPVQLVSNQSIQEEPKVVEEIKQPEPMRFEAPKQVGTWADQDDEDIDSPREEDEGFVEVTGRKRREPKPVQEEFQRGRRRGGNRPRRSYQRRGNN